MTRKPSKKNLLKVFYLSILLKILEEVLVTEGESEEEVDEVDNGETETTETETTETPTETTETETETTEEETEEETVDVVEEEEEDEEVEDVNLYTNTGETNWNYINRGKDWTWHCKGME